MSHPGFPLSAPVGLGICVIANLFLKCKASYLSVPAGAAQQAVPMGGGLVLVRLCHPQPFRGGPLAADGPGSSRLRVSAPQTTAANLLRRTAEPHRNVSTANAALQIRVMLRWEPRRGAKPPVPLPVASCRAQVPAGLPPPQQAQSQPRSSHDKGRIIISSTLQTRDPGVERLRDLQRGSQRGSGAAPTAPGTAAMQAGALSGLSTRGAAAPHPRAPHPTIAARPAAPSSLVFLLWFRPEIGRWSNAAPLPNCSAPGTAVCFADKGFVLYSLQQFLFFFFPLSFK